MFTYRQLILAVTILSAKIIFADILVPSYKHEYSNNPAYLQSQSIPDYKVSSAVEQYAKQLAAQHLKQHPSEVQTVHPSHYQNKVQSNLVAYPQHSLYHYPYHHHVSRPSGKLRYVKLGGHEYVRPSVFIGYPNTLAVHYRRKRSTDFTSAKSDKPALLATYDVATNPTLIDTKYPTAIDSLLPENESTNTNDKHVKKRRREANFATKPFLFGLDPNKMYSELKAKNLDSKEDETQHSVSKRHPATLITPVVLTQKFTPDSAKTTATEPAQRMLSTNQEKRQNQEASSTHHENPRPTPNVPSTTKTLEQSSSLITTSQKQLSEEESHKDYSEYYNYGSTYAYTLPTMSLRYPVPLTYRYWPSYIKYNAEISPSNKKEYPHQQDASNHPIIQQTSNQASSQETTTVGATNTAQPRHDQTHVHLCSEDVPCPTGNMGTNKPSGGAAPSMPTTTPACVTCTRYRSNEEPSRSEIISAPNPGTPQVFYTTPDDYTNYYSGEYIKDYQDNLGADYDYDENDYDEEPTYYTDGFHMYIKKNSAYSSNVPSNKIYDNTLYANINARSNVAPMTYVAVVSSDVPQVQKPLLAYYYPTKKTYASYKPQDYNYYKYYYNYHNTIDRYSNYRNLPYVFYRAISSPVYY